MKPNEFSFRIAETESELRKIYSLQYKVFVVDKELIDTNEDKVLIDEWDQCSYHIFCEINSEVIADGRLIKNSPIEFRVSSSIDLNKHFTDTNKIFEISALAVDQDYRHMGIGNSIHYFRLKLAAKLSGRFVIASCFRNTSKYLINIGFEIVIDKFHYKHYEAAEPSVFLAFDLSEGSLSFTKLNLYVLDNIELKTIQYIDRYIESINVDTLAAANIGLLP